MAFTGDYYIEDTIPNGGYAIDYTQGVDTIGDRFTVGTTAQRVDAATADFPWFIAYCTCDCARSGLMLPDRVPNAGAPLWTDTEILGVSLISAANHDFNWKTGGGINQGWYFGAPPLSRANLYYPHGSYYVNYPLMFCYGGHYGMGSNAQAPDLNSPQSEIGYGTLLSVWHEEWVDDGTGDLGCPERYIFKSVYWPEYIGGTYYCGILGATGGSFDTAFNQYMEGVKIDNFRLAGRKADAPEADGAGGNNYVTTYHSSGIAIQRAGSTSRISNIYADQFNNASFELISGTPACMDNCRGMFNNYASVWMRGDGKLNVFSYECDDCPTVFMLEGFDDEDNPGSYLVTPGGKIECFGLKVETGTAGNDNRKGTSILDGTGWVNAVFEGVQYVGLNSYPENLCRVEPFPSGFTGTSSYVKVSGLSVFGFVRSLMHHANGASSRKWMMPLGEYTVKYQAGLGSFEYTSALGGTCKALVGPAVRQLNIAFSGRMAWLDQSGGNPVAPLWNDSANTPAYRYSPLP